MESGLNGGSRGHMGLDLVGCCLHSKQRKELPLRRGQLSVGPAPADPTPEVTGHVWSRQSKQGTVCEPDREILSIRAQKSPRDRSRWTRSSTRHPWHLRVLTRLVQMGLASKPIRHGGSTGRHCKGLSKREASKMPGVSWICLGCSGPTLPCVAPFADPRGCV